MLYNSNSLRYILVVVCVLLSQTVYSGDRFSVTLVSPAPRTEGFWVHYEDIMRSAADDLNINLTVVYASGIDRFNHFAAVENVLNSQQKPDYIVTLFRRNTSERMLKLLEHAKVKFFASNTDIPDNTRQYIGNPRQKYKYWLGHIKPDDFQAGELLINSLVKLSLAKRKTNLNQPINIVAVTGSRDSAAVFIRNIGLKSVIDSNPMLKLQQLVFTDWRYQTVYDLAVPLIQRYPETDIVWCANDEIATAFVNALKTENIQHSMVIGGMDWSYQGIWGYRQHDLATSIGGHIIEGGIILALLRDFHDGYDFAEDIGLNVRLDYDAINEENIQLVNKIVLSSNWQMMDFSLLSKSMQGHRNNWAPSYFKILKNILDRPSPEPAEN